MTNRDGSERVSVQLEAGESEGPARPLPGTAFHIAVLGDFSGRGARGAAPRELDTLRPVLVDRDDLEEVLSRLAPELRAPTDGPPALIRIRELDDFHPDRLLETLPEPSSPVEVRGAASAAADAAAASHGAVPASGASLLEQIVTEAAGPGAPLPPPRASAAENDELRRFVRQALAGHVVAAPDARQGEVRAQQEREAGEQVAAILHDPDFQALEALWRGLQLLVRRLDTGPELKVFLLDVTRAELVADLLEHPVEQTGLYHALVDATVGTPGATPWALLVGCYTFGPEPGDAALLGRLGALARAAGAPWLAAADARLAGWPSFATPPQPEDWSAPDAPEWQALRRRPEAHWLGLVAPRLILRLPYGKDEPCERLAFEELGADPAHEHFLWGNPALAAALLLGESFTEDSWGLRPGSRAEIGGLPLPLLRDAAGEAYTVPCAETLLSERAAARMLEAGVMPLASLKDRDAVRLVHFQSIAGTPLRGRWASA